MLKRNWTLYLDRDSVDGQALVLEALDCFQEVGGVWGQ